MNVGPTPPPADVGISTAALSRLVRKRSGIMEWMQTSGIVLLVLALASIPLTLGIGTWADHQSLRKEWTPIGPACPVVAQISRAALGAKPPPPFIFQDVGFAYQIGAATCLALPQGWLSKETYPLCRFSAPAAIAVRVGGRTTLFEPGVGRGATVIIRHGRVSCILMAGMRD